MNNKEINIAEILRDKSKGTKLWTPIYGEVGFIGIDIQQSKYPIEVGIPERFRLLFTKYGKRFDTEGAELLLFPSKDMRNWSKFAWKEGDVLENTSDNVFPRYVLFKRFVDDKYTTFEAINGLILGDVPLKYSIQDTLSYSKVEDEEMALEIKKKIQNIVDKKPESFAPEFQPFDKVLVRDHNGQKWIPTLFGFFRKDKDKKFPYVTVDGAYKYYIPYNEKTKDLLGTKEPYTEE